jgi:chromosomal replication initiation ATPase DnaA
MRKKKFISYPSIGKAFNRDHSTAIHAFNKIEMYIEQNDKYLSDLVKAYEKDLNVINWEL